MKFQVPSSRSQSRGSRLSIFSLERSAEHRTASPPDGRLRRAMLGAPRTLFVLERCALLEDRSFGSRRTT